MLKGEAECPNREIFYIWLNDDKFFTEDCHAYRTPFQI